MTKFYASEQSQQRYGHLIEKVRPDLQGYDEIHVLSMDDLKKIKLTTLGKKLEDIDSDDALSVLGDSHLLQHLRDAGQVGQEKTLANLLAHSKISSHLGPHAMSLETQNGDRPFRVGFIVMARGPLDTEESHNTIDGLNSKQKLVRQKRGRDGDAQELSDFAFLHETGHLLKPLREGFKELKLDSLTAESKIQRLLRKQSGELEADSYAKAKMADKAETYSPIKDFLALRSINGAWSLASGKQELYNHYTRPFMADEVLHGVSYLDAIKAGENIQRVVDAETDRVFSKLASSKPARPNVRIDKDDYGAYCISQAKEAVKPLELIGRVVVSPEFTAAKNTLLKGTFKDCAGDYFDFRTQVLDSARKHFSIGTTERALLDDYMSAVTELGLGASAENKPTGLRNKFAPADAPASLNR